MTTWNCKAPAAFLALGVLAACEGGLDTSFLENLGGGGKDVALSQTQMAFGAVTLVAPSGFCIDKRSLKQQFALMARCDTLGVPSAAADAPLGIITASFSAATDSTLPSPSATATALGLTDVTDPVEDTDQVTFRASGGADIASDPHWRGTARIGDQIMGLALYGPEEGRAVGSEGRTILNDLIKASDPGS